MIIHESARPLVTAADFQHAHRRTSTPTSATCSTIPFTVAPVDPDSHRVTGSLDRDTLRNVQLPQKFRKATLVAAHEYADREGVAFTEDATLCAVAGFDVRFLEGADRNFKVTTPIDVQLAGLPARTARSTMSKSDAGHRRLQGHRPAYRPRVLRRRQRRHRLHPGRPRVRRSSRAASRSCGENNPHGKTLTPYYVDLADRAPARRADRRTIMDRRTARSTSSINNAGYTAPDRRSSRSTSPTSSARSASTSTRRSRSSSRCCTTATRSSSSSTSPRPPASTAARAG